MVVVGGSTKFKVKHQGKDIHHPPSTIYKWPLKDHPRSTLCPSLSLSFTKIALSIVYHNTLLCLLVNLTRLVHFKLIYLCSTCFINDIFLELAHYVTSPSDHHPPHPSTLSTWRNRFPCVRPVSELLVEPWTWTHLCLLTIKCWGWGVMKIYINIMWWWL